jgi:hypothetical protein
VGLYRYALMIPADPFEAEEAVHEVFARLAGRDGSPFALSAAEEEGV